MLPVGAQRDEDGGGGAARGLPTAKIVLEWWGGGGVAAVGTVAVLELEFGLEVVDVDVGRELEGSVDVDVVEAAVVFARGGRGRSAAAAAAAAERIRFCCRRRSSPSATDAAAAAAAAASVADCDIGPCWSSSSPKYRCTSFPLPMPLRQ